MTDYKVALPIAWAERSDFHHRRWPSSVLQRHRIAIGVTEKKRDLFTLLGGGVRDSGAKANQCRDVYIAAREF